MIVNFKELSEQRKRLKLDLKDRKILHFLSADSRMPYSRIAKSIGLSKDAVKYRINRLEKNGIIQEYTVIINTSLLGYDTYHLFIKLRMVDDIVQKRIISAIKELAFVKAIVEFNDKYDFEISFIARNVREADFFMEKILDIFSDYLQEHELLAITKFYSQRTLPRSFYGVADNQNENINESKQAIDEKDKIILQMLSTDASLPIYSVAQKIGLTPEATMYRLKKLKERGIINRFVPLINHSALGYVVYSVMLNIQNLSKGKEKSLSYFLSSNKNVLWAVKTLGKFNCIFYVSVRSAEEFHGVIKELRKNFSGDIKNYETLIAYKSHKYSQFPIMCMEKDNII